MGSLADGLPPEIAAQVHPDWRANEAAYWAARERLLADYEGLWIAFADGAVVASGSSPVEVFRAAQQTGRHPFVTHVGAESEPCRMRRAIWQAVPTQPLPHRSQSIGIGSARSSRFDSGRRAVAYTASP